MQIDIKQIDKQGWLEVPDFSCSDDALSIAKQLGKVIPHPNGDMISTVSPNDGKDKVTGTMSNRFGYSSFPMHTDTAFWLEPARYIVMGVLEKSDCNTKIVNFNVLLDNLNAKALAALETATYLINTIEGKRYSSPLIKTNREYGVKFDPSCMTPINQAAQYFHQAFLETIDNIGESYIDWTGRKAVIIDNWKVLHGRGEVTPSEKYRKLIRVYVR